MDNDPDFHQEDYFTDIFRVNENDGKLYRLVPFFSLNTKYGRVDDVGETTHIDESLLFETDPVMSLFGPEYRRKEYIHDLLVFSLGDYRDRDAVLYDLDQMTRYIEVSKGLLDFQWYSECGEYTDGEKEALELEGMEDFRDGTTRFFFSSKAQDNSYLMMLRFASYNVMIW